MRQTQRFFAVANLADEVRKAGRVIRLCQMADGVRIPRLMCFGVSFRPREIFKEPAGSLMRTGRRV